MRRKLLCLLLALALLAGCASAAERWQEQYDLGIRYLNEGSYEEALAAFTDAIAVDPNRPETYLQRAGAYLALGRTGEALLDYETARDLGGGAAAWAGLVEAYIQWEDYDTARRTLEEALALYPEDAALAGLLARLEELTAPEPGSDEYLDWAAEGVDLSVTEPVTLGGVPLPDTTLDSYGPLVPGSRLAPPGRNPDAMVMLDEKAHFNVMQYAGEPGVTLISFTLYDDGAPLEPYFWFDEPCWGGIRSGDTLRTALEKLGIAPEAIDWLIGSCRQISLNRGGTEEAPRSWLTVFLWDEEDTQRNEVLLKISDKEYGATAEFTFSADPDDPVSDKTADGSAMLTELYLGVNQPD